MLFCFRLQLSVLQFMLSWTHSNACIAFAMAIVSSALKVSSVAMDIATSNLLHLDKFSECTIVHSVGVFCILMILSFLVPIR